MNSKLMEVALVILTSWLTWVLATLFLQLLKEQALH